MNINLNVMRKIALLLRVLMILSFIFYGSTLRGADTARTTVVVLGPKGKPMEKRPRIPSRQIVTCAYDGENIEVEFLFPEGNADITITDVNAGIVGIYTINTQEESAMSIGRVETSIIEISTDAGNIYNGILILQ